MRNLFRQLSLTNVSTDLTAEILTKASEALLVKTKQWEDLEKPFHLCKVNSCYSFIQFLSNNDLQFLLRFLQQDQTGIHSTAFGDKRKKKKRKAFTVMFFVSETVQQTVRFLHSSNLHYSDTFL